MRSVDFVAPGEAVVEATSSWSIVRRLGTSEGRYPFSGIATSKDATNGAPAFLGARTTSH